jgi:endonuclease/exonuclease/phosphatase family metal-dependent hydrolase
MARLSGEPGTLLPLPEYQTVARASHWAGVRSADHSQGRERMEGLRRLARCAPGMGLASASTLLVAGCSSYRPPAEYPAAADTPACHATVPPSTARQGTDVRWSRDLAAAEVLGRWCAAVGRAMVRPARAESPDARRGEAARVDSLAVVSWNVHVGAGDVVRFAEDLRGGRLTGGQPVHHFVLLLQEVHRAGEAVPDPVPAGGTAPPGVYKEPLSGSRLDVEEVADRLSLSAYYVPSMRNGTRREDRGNAILSTLPLEEPEAVELPFEAQRRVAAVATVRSQTSWGVPWRLRVSSVHLDVWSRSGIRASLGRGRLRQATALVRTLDHQAPTALGGDFNTWSLREEVLPYLRRHFPQSPPPVGNRTHTTGRRLDHLFFRIPECWSARYRRIDDRYGSDHYPLLGWVSVGGCSA